MKTSILAGSVLAASLTALAFTTPVQAQLVSADVIVRSGPVRGHVVVDDGYSTYERRRVYEQPTRVVVVERVRGHGRFHNWKRHGYRQVRVYYVEGRYYDRYDRHRPGMREVVVYERDGHYYRDRDYDRDYDRDHRDHRDRDNHHDRDHDRWDH
jgi:hypothetical protein